MMRSLSRIEESWAFAALGAIYPSHATPHLSVGVCDLALADYLRDLFRSIPLTAVIGLRAAIWIVALAPPFVMRRMVTVIGLDARERQALLERLFASPRYGVRQLVVALKAIGGLFFGGAASVRAAIYGEGHLPAHPSSDVVPIGMLTARRSPGGVHVQRPCR